MPGLKIALELIHAAGIGIGAGRDSQYCFKRALQMERALLEGRAQPRQRDRLIEMLFDVAAYGFHHFHLRVSADRPRTAAQTGAIAGLLGVVGLAKKHNIFTPWMPRRARRPAIYPG